MIAEGQIPEPRPLGPSVLMVNLVSDGDDLKGDCTCCGAKGVSIMEHECAFAPYESVGEQFVRYKDGLGRTYDVPLSAVGEFERRRGILLWIKVIVLSVGLAALLWFSWTH